MTSTCLRRLSAARNFVRLLSTNIYTALNTYASAEECDVLIQTVGNSGVIELNRPKVLNALNLSMLRKIGPILEKWESTKKLVIIKGAGDEAFCAGGDVKSLFLELDKPNGVKLGKDYFKESYNLNHLIGTYKIPYVALIHGIVLGAGVGLAVHSKYRIATEKTLFALPETAIGIFPYIGGAINLKGKLGLYLGLTGYRLKGIDVLYAGIATHYVPSDRLETLTRELLSEGADIDAVLQRYHASNGNEEFSLSPYLDVINECFSARTVEDIIRRLETHNSKWAQKTIETLTKVSPTALKVTKKAIEEGGKQGLAECLSMQYRLVCAYFNKNSDFAEGVRALLIDKDQNPVWNPKKLEDISEAIIEQKFASVASRNELILSRL